MTDEQNEIPTETPSAEPAPPPTETPLAEPALPPTETRAAEPEWRQIQKAEDSQPYDPTVNIERPDKPPLPPTEE